MYLRDTIVCYRSIESRGSSSARCFRNGGWCWSRKTIVCLLLAHRLSCVFLHPRGSPDPYLLGAKKCGVRPEKCLLYKVAVLPIIDGWFTGVVFEDAPSGIRSGNAAGCKTVALLTTHTKEQIEACQADYIVENLSRYAIINFSCHIRKLIDSAKYFGTIIREWCRGQHQLER